MSDYKLIGHETYLEKFVTLYEKNELPNKILLSGKKGIGKSLLTEKFLYKIFNSNNDNELIKNKSHPNVLNIKKNNEKKNNFLCSNILVNFFYNKYSQFCFNTICN